jgi:MFS family permease
MWVRVLIVEGLYLKSKSLLSKSSRTFPESLSSPGPDGDVPVDGIYDGAKDGAILCAVSAKRLLNFSPPFRRRRLVAGLLLGIVLGLILGLIGILLGLILVILLGIVLGLILVILLGLILGLLEPPLLEPSRKRWSMLNILWPRSHSVSIPLT